MFRRDSFRSASFSTKSWRFDGVAPPVAVEVSLLAPGDDEYEPRQWTEFRDDDLLQMAVGLILSGVLEQ